MKYLAILTLFITFQVAPTPQQRCEGEHKLGKLINLNPMCENSATVIVAPHTKRPDYYCDRHWAISRDYKIRLAPNTFVINLETGKKIHGKTPKKVKKFGITRFN